MNLSTRSPFCHEYLFGSMDDWINIGWLDRVDLIRALWYRTVFVGITQENPTRPSEKEMRIRVEESGTIDLISGKPIKIFFYGNLVNPGQYDDFAGKGVFGAVLAELTIDLDVCMV